MIQNVKFALKKLIITQNIPAFRKNDKYLQYSFLNDSLLSRKQRRHHEIEVGWGGAENEAF